MNHIRWAAWGVIELDNTSKFDRMQRRNYIKAARAQLAEKNIKLECGGSTMHPHYLISLPTPLVEIKLGHGGAAKTVTKPEGFAAGGPDAFKKVCMWVLEKVGDHERSEDGGVWSAGTEA